MASIRDLSNPWRDKLRQASFRGAVFHVETNARASGRRVALHESPKRNDPYAEDMGRRARRWAVQGYLIGPFYLDDRDLLIEALEADGPGTLQLPLPYLGESVEAMVAGYNCTESRERGGFVAFEMEFVEAGKPGFATEIIETKAVIEGAAAALDRIVTNA